MHFLIGFRFLHRGGNVAAVEIGYVLGEELMCLLQQAAARLAVEMAPALDEHDLALPAWRILAQLWLHGTMRVGNLADRLGLEVSTVSRTVARLERRGLLARHRAGLDRRATNLRLTEEGSRLIQAVIPAISAVQRPLKTGFTASEQRTLKLLLKRIPAMLDGDSQARAADTIVEPANSLGRHGASA
jgi:DNA-binding MarR family transcriptional regulator